MSSGVQLSARILTPPRAAAFAGLIFSLLLVVTLAIVRFAAGSEDVRPGSAVTDPTLRGAMRLALTLVPFVGISFLWFLGVLRNRLGNLEDQFFGTVFLGSGLLFVASLFAASAVAGGVLSAMAAGELHLPHSEAYSLGRHLTYVLLNVFSFKMAGVFMFSACVIALRTGIFPRWVAFTGFACGLVLILAISTWLWVELLFPLWMLLLSVHILAADIRRRRGAA